MTKILCYIIDQNTETVAGQYEDYKRIGEEGIKKIKEEISKLLLGNTTVELKNKKEGGTN